jgi:nucleotide-binding universal stress UspA family protein
MQRIRHILVATDFSRTAKNAAKRAAMIATEQGASLEILHVLSDPGVTAIRKMQRVKQQAQTQLRTKAGEQLDALRADLASAYDITISATVRVGAIRAAIQQVGKNSDLLVIGNGGARTLSELFFGTTASSLLRAIRVPLLVVKQRAIAPYVRALAAVDLSAHAAAILTMTGEIAPRSQITALHAYDGRFAGRLRIADASDERVAQWREEARARAASKLGGMLIGRASAFAPWRLAIVEGDIGPAILEVSQQWPSDLVSIGNHARSFIGRILVGSVARATLSAAQCDVLVVP